MNKKLDENSINKIINAPVDGGVATSYQVHCTSDRVMLFFGVIPKSHMDVLESLINEQTDGTWIRDSEIASMVGAEAAIGLPVMLKKF